MDLDLYNIDELNLKEVTVLYASPEFYTDFGKACRIGEYLKGVDVLELTKGEDELFSDANIACLNKLSFSGSMLKSNAKFVYFSEIANDDKLMRGLKLLTCESVNDIIKAIGFDVFALYVNRTNLCYIGYHNKGDKILSRGCIRELRDTYNDLSDLELCDKWCTPTDKSGLVSKTSIALLPYIQFNN